jgi:UDP-N-acetylmuramoyl-tripeptide--D-alanyl-D-alanine ligase
MRGQICEIGAFTVWNDTYNANPKAVEYLLETLQKITTYRRKLVVLGDMLELGDESAFFHKEIGKKAATSGLDRIITVGTAAKDILNSAVESGFSAELAFSFDTAEDAASFLSTYLRPGDLVAVKGSRGLKLEKIVTFLEETAA